MYERILVPSDGSDGAVAAFDHALSLALVADAEVHVVHAVDPTLVPVEISADRGFEALREAGEELVGEHRERAEAEGVAIVTAVLNAPAYQAITEYAEAHDADLLVMGTHGRTGLDRWLVGSVTERVVRTATVPVLSVHPPEK